MEEIILSAVFGKLAGEVFESFSENTFRTVCLSKSNFSVGFTGFSAADWIKRLIFSRLLLLILLFSQNNKTYLIKIENTLQ